MSNIGGLASVSKENALKNAAARKLGTQKKYKGKYAGPDKYKGQVPAHLKSKYKGKYFGKEAGKGANPTVSATPTPDTGQRKATVMPEGWRDDPKYANPTKKTLKSPEARATAQARLAEAVKERSAFVANKDLVNKAKLASKPAPQ